MRSKNELTTLSSNTAERHAFPRLLIMLLTVLAIALPAGAQNPLEGKSRDDALLKVMRSYTPWKSVELNGKLQSDRIPLGIKPSVKVYMKRGEAVMISIRATLMGEVARLEAWGDTVMIVNKPKRTYCKAPLRQLFSGGIFSIADLQSVLLGRVAVLGQGELSVGNATLADIYSDGESGFMLTPSSEARIPKGIEYGFLTYPDGRLQALLVRHDGSDTTSSLIYDYSLGGDYTIVGEFPMGGKTLTGTLDFDTPKWGAAPFSRFTPPSSYTRLGVNQFLRSI